LRASIPFSYGLSIFDHDRAGITIFTEQGIAGLIVNDTDDALSWAEKQYERVNRTQTRSCCAEGLSNIE